MTDRSSNPRSTPPLTPGTVIGSIRVDELIATDEAGARYQGEHFAEGAVRVEFLAPALAQRLPALEPMLETARSLEHRSLAKLIEWGEYLDESYLAYGWVEARSMAHWLGTEQAPRPLSFRDAYNVLGHVVTALEALHGAGVHGALGDDNILIERGGRVRIAEFGYARLRMLGLGVEHAEFRDSPYVAPETREDPWSATEATDFWSVGVLAVAMLAGHSPTPESLDRVLAEVCEPYPPELHHLLAGCVDREPGMRISSASELRQELAGVLAAVRATGPHAIAPQDDSAPAVDASGGSSVEIDAADHERAADDTQSAGEPVTDAGSDRESAASATDGTDDLFAGIELPPAPAATSDRARDGEERWIVHRDGRDFGPYTSEQIRAQLRSDEIDENTMILDLYTHEMVELIDVPAFTDFVIDYIPERQKQLIEEQERRDEVVRRAKRAGATMIVSLVLGGLALLGGIAWWFFELRVDPAPFPAERIVGDFRYRFTVSEPARSAIAANEEIMRVLRGEAPVEPERATPSRRRPGTRAAATGDDGPPPASGDEEVVVNLDPNAGPSRKLTHAEISTALLRQIERYGDCFEAELRRNPNFRGVDVDFSIHPDGHTFGVSVRGRGSTSSSLESCLVRGFRRVRFPAFNDLPMNVTYPFNLR